MDGRLLPCGERAVLIEVDGLDAVLALRDALAPLAGRGAFAAVTDVVPAAMTVLLVLDHFAPVSAALGAPRFAQSPALARVRDAVAELLRGLTSSPGAAEPAPPVLIDVRYDGVDLAEVAELSGLSPAEVIAAHTGTDWTVAFSGFAPGFGYLVGGDSRLQVPRRAEPRTRVPAGAVGLAGAFSGVYPRASPGGWQLIGRTDAELWDLHRDPPALFTPGRRVRFRAVAELSTPSGVWPSEIETGTPERVVKAGSPGTGAAPASHLESARETTEIARSRAQSGRSAGREPGPPGLTVLAVGAGPLLVDEGRPGFAALGVGPSGAADRASYRLGNRLAGNPPGATALEVMLDGLVVRAQTDCLVVLTGADCHPRCDGRPANHAGPIYLRRGQELRLATPDAGLRTYLCAAGGFAVPPVLGSASTDTLAGIGPPPVKAGDLLPIGSSDGWQFSAIDQAPIRTADCQPVELDVLPGPRTDWVAEPAELARTWTIAPESDRVGVRLVGAPLSRRSVGAEGELPSEPMVRGSIQLPAHGLPIIAGADHPVTGGYPVVGVLTEQASDRLAQCRPGQTLRLRFR